MRSLSQERPASEDRDLELTIGRLLRIGVLIAAGTILLGGVLNVLRHGYEPVTWEKFNGEPAALRSLSGIAEAAFAAQGKGIIQLGLILLVAVPVVRVAASVLVYLRKKDFIFAAITFLVLGILCYSIFVIS
jgi:uncharacterized membrane protein